MWVHAIDNKETVDRNYYHGWNHTNGDFICYHPEAPYKGEGTDFYEFYYEHLLRLDNYQGRAANNAKIQVWTPNEKLFNFPYANEVVEDECHKRGIEVFYGWEMIEMKTSNIGEKIAVFKNKKTGETIEKDFHACSLTRPSKPHS